MESLKCFFVLVLFFLLHTTLTPQNVSPQFSELKGMEDAQGKTHLLYRIHSYQSNGTNISSSNDIFNLIPGSSTDTIFLYDGYTCNIIMGWGATVRAYDIWNNDLSQCIYAGEFVNCFEPYFVISRFDSNIVYGDMFVDVQKIIISKQDDSLVFALPNLISTNGGFDWDTLQLAHQLVSVSQFDDAVYFSLDFTTSYTSAIFKSTDSGNTFTIVDTGGTEWNPNFYYDIDENHIYRTHTIDYPNRSLKGSANQGNAFTWQTLYETSNDFFVCLDASQSGAIYLADGKKIFFSVDYGSTFNLYKELDNRIIGIYKKPNSEILYAASKYQIYEISPDTTMIIKSLPIPNELLNYYPLALGNYWIYRMEIWDNWPIISYSEDTFTRKVISKEILSNNKEYFKIEETYHGSAYTNHVFERVDSVNGLVYRFDNECSNSDSEKVIDDFTSEVGDSLLIQRYTMCWDSILTLFSTEGNENIFNENRNYKSFEYNWLVSYNYKLAQGLGIHNIRWGYDFGSTEFLLKGCVVDGIIYGDTTLTGVADENELPNEFFLSQNYPNPFNPQTTISYSIPNSSLVQIQIFDVLGKEVLTLLNEEKSAGNYKLSFNASDLTSGVYFYQLRAGDFIQTKKMILLK